MGWPVVTVASGGLPVIDVTGTFPRLGVPVSEAANGRGTPVTKVVAPRMALAVTFVVPPLLMLAGAADGREADRDRAGRWRVDRRSAPPARSSLPCPNVISDAMPPTEQVDG